MLPGTSDVMVGDAEVAPAKLASAKRTLRYVAAFYGFLALMLFPLPVLLVFMVATDDRQAADAGMLLFGGILLAAGALLMLAAVGLWRQRYRWAVLLVTCLIMLAFPIGTIVGGLTLAVVFGAAGKRLFAPHDLPATGTLPSTADTHMLRAENTKSATSGSVPLNPS